MDARLLIVLLFVTATTGETIKVITSSSLEEYLCPENRTLPPNTDIIITVPLIELQKNDVAFCLIENTTNIKITSSQELINSKQGYAKVKCSSNTGFGFFNVTNLVVSFVYFLNCENLIPQMAIRYINESNQFLYYQNVYTTMIFNHCCELTLLQVFTGESDNHFGVIGANICGTSSVKILNNTHYTESNRIIVLMYYTDSGIAQLSSTYDLHVESDMIQVNAVHTDAMNSLVSNHPDQIPISVEAGFGLYLTQQQFDVNVSVTIDNKRAVRDYYPLTILILFVNSVTRSKVTFQGNSNELCHKLDTLANLISLDIKFYETPTFRNTSTVVLTPITVRNTAFSGSWYTTSVLSIQKITRKLSHRVTLQNLSWCLTEQFSNLLQAESFCSDGERGKFLLSMENINMHGNNFNSATSPGISDSSLINLINIDNATMSGVNYFARNFGGSVINIASSSLTITGNLTVYNGSAYKGGAISLNSAATLFLKEPLTAVFSHNSAMQGNAIYAPSNKDKVEQDGLYTPSNEHVSGIQILPNKIYSLENITDIDIHLTFINNTYNGNIQRSLYAPYFSYLGQQIVADFQFNEHTWDSNHSQWAYTTLMDSILTHMYDLDKYSSLDNGVCIQVHDRPPWNCSYVDRKIDNYGYFLNDITVNPGEVAFSILNMDDNVYYMYSCHDEKVIAETFWNKTTILTNLTKYLRFEFYHFAKCIRVVTVLNNRAVFKVPIIRVHTTESCPVGFNLSESGKCDCITPLSEHGYQCDINTKTFANPPGYWSGFHNSLTTTDNVSTISFSTHCPPGYCNLECHQDFVLGNNLGEFYCNDNRNGTLCGKCKANYSSMFGSDECHSHCSNLYLLTIPVYAIAGLILVVALFALRLTVASGTINGVIFYANATGLVMRIIIGDHMQVHFRIMYIIISLLNLELGFPICFYSGMTPAAKVGLQFVFPVYLWLLVLILVVLSRYSVKVTNLILNSSVQVLATLSFLSFAKILRNVIDIVSYSSLQSIDSYTRNMTISYGDLKNKLVWFYDGSDYGQGTHGFYLFLAAALCIFFLIPYGIFSLGITCYCSPFSKMKLNLKPFVDAYCGPFKDKWRFWFGLRLWVTALLYAIAGGLQGANANAMFAAHVFIIGALLFLQALIRPFKNCFITILDTFFMLNYWFAVELYLLLKMIGFQGFLAVYACLLSAAIFVLCLIIVGHICVLKYPTLLSTLRVRMGSQRSRYRYKSVPQDDSDTDQQLFEAAETRDTDRIVDTY